MIERLTEIVNSLVLAGNRDHYWTKFTFIRGRENWQEVCVTDHGEVKTSVWSQS